MTPSTTRIVAEIEADLRRTLDCWFPRCIGDQGGFRQSFDRRWAYQPDSTLSLVYQARMTWVLATVARRRPHSNPAYLEWAAQGLRFLERQFADPRHGGLWFDTQRREEKHSYGIAFAIFAAAACARCGDAHAREFAGDLFEWWTEQAFDGNRGAYADALDPTGHPLVRSTRDRDLIRVPYGLTSANTHLHAIEALTELFRTTRDERVGARLAALVERVEWLVRRDRALYTTYSTTWRPVDRSISYGHDVEAVFLVLEARASLGWSSDTPLLTLLEQALRAGIDKRFGGMYFGRGRFRRVRDKVDWVQAEALNTLGYMIPHARDPEPYHDALAEVWRFISQHVIDDTCGGWLGRLDRQGRPLDDRKGHRWKACYHPVRALLNASDCLRHGAIDDDGALTTSATNAANAGHRTD